MDIGQIVTDYIVDQYLKNKAQNLTEDTLLFEQGILHSMTFIELAQFLENRFSINIEDHEYIPDYYVSITRIKAFVELKLAVANIA